MELQRHLVGWGPNGSIHLAGCHQFITQVWEDQLMLNGQVESNLSSVGAKTIDVHLGTVLATSGTSSGTFRNCSKSNWTGSKFSAASIYLIGRRILRAFHVLHQNYTNFRRHIWNGCSSGRGIHWLQHLPKVRQFFLCRISILHRGNSKLWNSSKTCQESS